MRNLRELALCLVPGNILDAKKYPARSWNSLGDDALVDGLRVVDDDVWQCTSLHTLELDLMDNEITAAGLDAVVLWLLYAPATSGLVKVALFLHSLKRSYPTVTHGNALNATAGAVLAPLLEDFHRRMSVVKLWLGCNRFGDEGVALMLRNVHAWGVASRLRSFIQEG